MNPLLLALSITALIQCWVFGIIFIVNGRKRNSNYLLGIFLIIYTAGYIPWALNQTEYFRNIPGLRYIASGFFFLIAPLFYIYARKVVGVYQRRDLAHLLPGIMESMLLFSAYIIGEKNTNLVYMDGQSFTKFIYNIFWPIYSIVYLFLTIRLVDLAGTLIPLVYTHVDNKKIRWIKVTACILILDYVSELIIGSFTVIEEGTRPAYAFVLVLVDLVVIYWICISGLRQEELDLGGVETEAESAQGAVSDNKANSNEQQVFQAIERSVREQGLYRNKELSLYLLAEQVGQNYKLVSRLINQYSGKNFSQFINQFRVEEAKKLLLDPDHSHRNLNGIADLVGFYSRSAFFNTFKSLEGCTPAEYKKLNSKTV